LTHEIRIVKVDAATGAAQTLDPIAMRVEGTASGHTQLAYADGSLWLWGTVEGSSEIHEVSTQTGEVERVITNAPAIGGTEPVMAATPGQLWLAGGPGVPPTLARLDTTTGSLTNGPSLAADAPGTVEWLASRGNEVDVGVLGTGLTGTTPRSHIVAVATDGSVLHNVEVDDVGGQVVATSGTLWTLMASSHCEHIVLSWIDTSTFTPVRIHSFPGSAPCTASGPRHLAAVGPHVFVLDQGLYRVTL
jgi:hypothetical protein